MTLNEMCFHWPYMYDQVCVALAREDDPNGEYCGFCGAPNDNADDCGWWYEFGHFPACKNCFELFHPFHQAVYGVGER